MSAQIVLHTTPCRCGIEHRQRGHVVISLKPAVEFCLIVGSNIEDDHLYPSIGARVVQIILTTTKIPYMECFEYGFRGDYAGYIRLILR